MNTQLKTTLTMLAADREKVKLLFAQFDHISRRAKALPQAALPANATTTLCIEERCPSK